MALAASAVVARLVLVVVVVIGKLCVHRVAAWAAVGLRHVIIAQLLGGGGAIPSRGCSPRRARWPVVLVIAYDTWCKCPFDLAAGWLKPGVGDRMAGINLRGRTRVSEPRASHAVYADVKRCWYPDFIARTCCPASSGLIASWLEVERGSSLLPPLRVPSEADIRSSCCFARVKELPMHDDCAFGHHLLRIQLRLWTTTPARCLASRNAFCPPACVPTLVTLVLRTYTVAGWRRRGAGVCVCAPR